MAQHRGTEADANVGQLFLPVIPSEGALFPLGDHQSERATANLDHIALLLHIQGQVFIVQLEFGFVWFFALVVDSLQPQHIHAGSGNGHFQDSTFHAALIFPVTHAEQPEAPVILA